MMTIVAAAETFEMNGTALFLIIVGGIIIWLIMTFLFANLESGVDIIVLDEDTRPPKKKYEIRDIDDDRERKKEEAYLEKKKRQRRKEMLRRLRITLKNTGILLLESSWMVGLSIAVILTVYYITQNMLID